MLLIIKRNGKEKLRLHAEVRADGSVWYEGMQRERQKRKGGKMKNKQTIKPALPPIRSAWRRLFMRRNRKRLSRMPGRGAALLAVGGSIRRIK